MALTKDQILGANDADLVKVEVPEWGGEIYLRPLSAYDFERWQTEAGESRNVGLVRAKAAVRSVCDAEGNRIFADSDAEAVSKKAAKVLIRLDHELLRLNTVTESGVGSAEKN